MFKLLSRCFVISAVALTLSGCLFGRDGYIHDRHEDYLHSQSDPHLKLPANLRPAEMKPYLPIPQAGDFSTRAKPSLVPPVNENAALLEKEQQAEKSAAKPLKATLGTGATGFPVLKLASSYEVSWFKIKKVVDQLKYQIIGSDQKTGVIEVMTSASDNSSSEIYQIKLAAGSKGTLVNVLDQTGDELDAKTASSILRQLQQAMGK